MIKDITIAAKAELKDETIVKLGEGQKEIELAKIAAISGAANSAFEFLILTQKARIAEAEGMALDSKARIAEAEAQKAKYEVEKAKYNAESDAAFRKSSVKSAKKPYTNGTAVYGE
jgi:hypothetical protein